MLRSGDFQIDKQEGEIVPVYMTAARPPVTVQMAVMKRRKKMERYRFHPRANLMNSAPEGRKRTRCKSKRIQATGSRGDDANPNIFLYNSTKEPHRRID